MLKKLLVISTVTLMFAGCASVPLAPQNEDQQAKTFTAKSNTAGLYIYRNETFGAANKLKVSIDGQEIGKTAAKTYFYKEVQPGKHVISSKAENTSELTVDALAGKVYYIWQEVKLGAFSARTKLQLVDEATGQKGVSESKLIK
jgi:PBP1b-binding outer membrane lipoprotein LpoB